MGPVQRGGRAVHQEPGRQFSIAMLEIFANFGHSLSWHYRNSGCSYQKARKWVVHQKTVAAKLPKEGKACQYLFLANIDHWFEHTPWFEHYRVTHQVNENLLLTLLRKLYFSIQFYFSILVYRCGPGFEMSFSEIPQKSQNLVGCYCSYLLAKQALSTHRGK